MSTKNISHELKKELKEAFNEWWRRDPLAATLGVQSVDPFKAFIAGYKYKDKNA